MARIVRVARQRQTMDDEVVGLDPPEEVGS